MANKEKIESLLSDIRKLETWIADMREAEVYPVSFFSRTFDLTHKILKDLHILEADQIETFRKQMEAHQALLQSIPTSVTTPAQPMEKQQEAEPQEMRQESEKPVEESVQAISEPTVTPIEPTPVMAEPKSKEPERSGLFLNDLIEKQNLSDFRKAFSLNDRFRFRRELFGGDEVRMNKVINDLNDLHSYDDSINYLNNELNWNLEDEAAADFVKLIEKRFL